MLTIEAFDEAVRAHDARIAATGFDIWVGSEPTFTDRHSADPHWLHEALGGDKEARAVRLLAALHAGTPGALVLRSEGRRYAGEKQPRWNFGLMRRRDGTPLWDAPCDPLVGDGDETGAQVEALPDFGGDCSAFLEALSTHEQRAREGRTATVFTGCIPPVDARLAMTTVTPDPAVVEVNAEPCSSASDFLALSRAIYAAAAEAGLTPYRLQFNGAVGDSGGGGQITLGGPSPQTSPFVVEPRLLPRLVRFLNRHPALSYLYCHDFVGSGGQSVRSDECGTERFDELRLALALLEGQPALDAQQVWQALAPFLADSVGNSHRAEINVEKLANPFGGPRGALGLVEFRALRMQHTPERMTALACLLRAIVAMLATTPYDVPLVDWGRELHDRYALPWQLQRDLAAVFTILEAAGFGLDASIVTELERDEFRHQATLALPGATLEIWRALEFWPLVGDTSSPEQTGTSRLMDASTARIELRLIDDPGSENFWQAQCAGRALPLQPRDGARVAGLRYRSFVPNIGLHPMVPAQTPLIIELRRGGADTQGERRRLTLHDWRPNGGPYPGLPADLTEAAQRRAERVVIETISADAAGPTPPPASPQAHTLDLRWPA